MAFVTWLPEVLRNAGVNVQTLDGALSRSTNRSGILVHGVVWHDTVTRPTVSDGQVLRILRDGHSTLPGPLSQVGVSRDGTWHIVAMGKCNHNGYGEWGNDSIGLEFFNAGAGSGERFTTAQIVAGIKGTAAILRHQGLGIDRVLGHKETDPRRKVDPWSVDMTEIRTRIHHVLDASDHRIEEDELMAIDPTCRGQARTQMRVFLGRSPGSYAELDYHAAEIRRLGLNAYIEWLEGQQEAKDYAAKVRAEIRTPDAT